MCEVESSGVTGNGMASSVERLNLSCPEGITEAQRDSIQDKTTGEEGKSVPQEDTSSASGDLSDRRGSLRMQDPLRVTPRVSIVEDAEAEGVDPFSPKGEPQEEKTKKDTEERAGTDHLQPIPSSPVNAPKERRGSKSVNFKEPEIDVDVNENGNATTNDAFLTGSTSSNGSSSCKEDGTVGKKAITKQRSLGETNPVYRLSMKLSPNLFNIQEIPGANQHREVEKVGYLTKLSGRSFPYIPQWKRRYCVLSKGRLYYYEREDSKSGDKSNGVINLEYFDQVTEAGPKECKKATNVFIITSQDRSFFDPGRHMFSADTLPDMRDWVRKLQVALEQIRNNNRPTTTSPAASVKKDAGKKGKEGVENKENKENKENAQNSTKDRKKKKDSHRPRKSARVGDGPEAPSQGTDLVDYPTPKREAEVSTMASPVGIQLPGMASPRGIQLPGMSSKKEVHPEETKEKSDANQQTEDGLPISGPTLPCVTKLRVKGPQGRRVPQNHRRTMAAAALKKRASSLSALEYQDLNDSSEAPWLNRSLDMLDEANPPRDGEFVGGHAPALPYKAYNYSTDEEMDDEGEHSQSDSFPTSAAAMPPPPPPRSASYGLEARRHPHLGQVGRQTLHRSLGDAQGSGGDVRGSKRSLGDGRMYGLVGEWHGSSSGGDQWVGSHNSLGQNGEILGSASPVMDDLDNLLMNQSVQHTSMALDSASESGSEGSTCRPAGRQHSRQQQHPQQQQQSHINHQSSPKQSKHRKRSGPDLSRFAVAVKHLQRHVVEIDRAVFGITGEVSGTRQEVTALKEAVLALQADTDTITSTLSHLTQEAISAQQKITFATQEAEKVRRIASVALKEAEQAKQDQLKIKKEYENLVGELRSTLKSLKEQQTSGQLQIRSTSSSSVNKDAVVVPTKHDDNTPKAPVPKVSDTKSPEVNFKPAEDGLKTSSPKSSRASGSSITTSLSTSRVPGSSLSGVTPSPGVTSPPGVAPSPGVAPPPGVTPPPVSKSSSFTQVSSTPKVPAYQSLFTRPSSLISGLTYRSSLTKSVSFADQKEGDKEPEKNQEATTQKENSEKKKEVEKSQETSAQKENEEKKKKEEKHQSTLERKETKETKHHHKGDEKNTFHDTNSKERQSKEKKDSGSVDRRERKHRHSSRDKRNHMKENKDAEHIISDLSLEEDIPMVDDSNEVLDKAGKSDKKSGQVKQSSLSHGTQTPSNFSLGKSSSSPVVSPGTPVHRPRMLPLRKDRQMSDRCNSNASTPESPMVPSPFPQAPSPCSRPTSPYSRSSTALPTVEENHIKHSSSFTSLHRPGSTPGPLARQGSMTTVPEDRAVVGPPPSRPGVFAISRQNSSPNIPLQRQNSGISIPLQRQHSLGVVPEESRLLRQESLMSVPEDRPLADQTLPLSPSASVMYFPISPSSSITGISETARRTALASMELVTGPVLAGSSMQEASATGTLAVLSSPEEETNPAATSTLKKEHKPQRDVDGVAV